MCVLKASKGNMMTTCKGYSVFIAVFVAVFVTHVCFADQIVVTRGTHTRLTSEDISLLTTYLPLSDGSNITYRLFEVGSNMTSVDLLAAAKVWKQAGVVTAIVDLTSDCRVTVLAAVTAFPLIRASLVRCPDVKNDISIDILNVRPGLEVYTQAAFSYFHVFGSCLARVVLLTEFQADLTAFPTCYKGTAIPLLARVVGAWPLSKQQTNQTAEWLKGVASRSSLHYIAAVGSSNFLHAMVDLGWVELLPPTFFQWVFVVTDTPTFNCSGCFEKTPLFHHQSPPGDSNQLPSELNRYLNNVDALYTWKAFQTATNATIGASGQIVGDASYSSNLTLDVQIMMQNATMPPLGRWIESWGLLVDEKIRPFLHDPSIIRVATIESPPFVFKITDENGTRYEGYAIDVIHEVATRLELQYSFTEVSDGQFGVSMPNGTWNGIIGDILAGSVDLAVGPLTVTAEREAVLDFTTPFYEFAGIEILMKEETQEQNLLFFVTVFSKPMWAAWSGVLLFTGLLLAAFDYLSPFSERNKRLKEMKEEDNTRDRQQTKKRVAPEHRDSFNLKESLWLVTASFTMSGPESTPRTLSSRTLVAGFWFFCSIIMANYTANLAAFLTTSRLTTPINSLQDLASQSKVKYSVVRGTTTMTYFERMARIESNFYELWKNISSNSAAARKGGLGKSELAVWDYPLGDTYVKIWSDIVSNGLLSTSVEGLEKVMAGDFALVDEAPYLQYAISQHCGLTTIGKQFSTRSYAFALPQGSPLTDQVSNFILKLQSETVLEKLKTKWWSKTAVGCEKGVDESEGLSFHTLGGVFMLAGVGVSAGLLLCLLESGWAWMSASRRRKRDSMPPVTSRTDLVENRNQEFDMDVMDTYDTITTADDNSNRRQQSLF